MLSSDFVLWRHVESFSFLLISLCDAEQNRCCNIVKVMGFGLRRHFESFSFVDFFMCGRVSDECYNEISHVE